MCTRLPYSPPSPPNGKQISHLPRRSSSHSSAQRQASAIYSLPRWSVEGKCTTIRCFSAWLPPPSYPLHVDAAGFPPTLHLHFCLILSSSTHPILLLLYVPVLCICYFSHLLLHLPLTSAVFSSPALATSPTTFFACLSPTPV
jgi:hypothetical protein